MADRAQVKSVDAIEDFRSALIIYISKARPVLEEVGGDVTRLRNWLETDQRAHWEGQLKRRLRSLEQAQQTLFSARISNLRQETSAEVQALHRAKRQVEEAEQKLRMIRNWDRDFDTRVQPLVKQIEKLHTLFANELPKGIAHLAQLVKALDTYMEMPAPAVLTPGPSPQQASEDSQAAAKESQQ